MSAFRIVLLVLALAVVAFVAKFTLTGGTGGADQAVSQPKQQLDRVRERAHEIEDDLKKRAEEGSKLPE